LSEIQEPRLRQFLFFASSSPPPSPVIREEHQILAFLSRIGKKMYIFISSSSARRRRPSICFEPFSFVREKGLCDQAARWLLLSYMYPLGAAMSG